MRTFVSRTNRIPGPVLLVVTALLVLSTGCRPRIQLPPVPAADAGDESFVRQVIPILLGRKVRGYEELKMQVDLIHATNRETALRALMKQPEFVGHWSEVLFNDLRVHREGSKAQSTCFGDPLQPGNPAPGVATHVLTHASSATFASPFNMSDLIRSAIAKDNLYPIYRAYMLPMATQSDGANEQDRRNDLGSTFGRVYLNREMGCLLCHNSESSLSGAGTGWNRTHPITGYFEKALFGASTGRNLPEAFAVFRTDVNGGPEQPWGMPGCGTFKTTVGDDSQTAYFAGSLGTKATVRDLSWLLHFGYSGLKNNGLDRSLPATEQSQCSFCQSNCQGVSLSPDAPNNAPNAAQVKTLLTTKCYGCHAPASDSGGMSIPNDNTWFTDLVSVSAGPAGEVRVRPGDADNSYIIKKLEGLPGISGNRMPPGGPYLTPAEIDTIKTWINGIPDSASCNVCSTLNCNPDYPTEVQGYEAFAFLTAARVTENIWKDVMGHSLTIANYFPRNDAQQGALWNLTEYNFIPNDWSLQELLVRVLTSNFFNRTAPRVSPGTTAYDIPLALDPWVEADPRVPPVSDVGYDPAAHPESHHNAMGEGGYRYSTRSLLNSIHGVLGWPAPARFPAAAGYPNRDLEKGMGEFFTDAEPGTQSLDLQSLLLWESVHGVCQKPSGMASDDWLDMVAAAAAAFPAGGPGGPLTIEDVIVTMRDWMLGDGTIGSAAPVDLTASERQALEAYLGVPLTTPVSAITGLPAKLRGTCGVLVETPQFMLAGIAPRGLGPKPRLRVCTSGSCTYQEICNALKPAVDALLTSPQRLSCGVDTVSVTEPFRIRPDTLCPRGVCNFIPLPRTQVAACLNSRAGCLPQPTCDPRCNGIDCCGGPVPPPDKRGFMVAWLDQAKVQAARGVRIRRAGEAGFQALQTGETLREGDMLAVGPESVLDIASTAGSLKTPAGGLPKGDGSGTRLLLVTGARALNARTTRYSAREAPKPPQARIDMQIKQGWAQYGEAGRPLLPEERRGYVGPEQKTPPRKQ